MFKRVFVGVFLPLTLALSGCVPECGVQEEKGFIVDPMGATSLPIYLDSGEVLSGYFEVRGGNNDINFYISDPYGNVVSNPGIVIDRYDFRIEATYSGNYRLWFDNTFSVVTSKSVVVRYRK